MKKYSYLTVCCFLLLILVCATRLLLAKPISSKLVAVLVLLAFFLNYGLLLLSRRGQQSFGQPFWISREIGYGVGLNPKNPLAYKIACVLVIGLILFLGVGLVQLTFY